MKILQKGKLSIFISSIKDHKIENREDLKGFNKNLVRE